MEQLHLVGPQRVPGVKGRGNQSGTHLHLLPRWQLSSCGAAAVIGRAAEGRAVPYSWGQLGHDPPGNIVSLQLGAFLMTWMCGELGQYCSMWYLEGSFLFASANHTAQLLLALVSTLATCTSLSQLCAG